MEIADYLRFVAALGLVVGLILACAWGARRFGLAPMAVIPTGTPRLALLETRMIDARRQLVLVRRDGVEHLLLLGPTGDLIIEASIAPRIAEQDGTPSLSETAPEPWPTRTFAVIRKLTERRA